MTEHQILLSIRKNKCSIGYLELLNQNLTEDFPDPKADKARIRHLISENCVSGSLKSGGRLYLEPKGMARLDQMQQELDKLNNNRANHEIVEKRTAKKQQHSSNHDSWQDVLTAVSTAISTVTALTALILQIRSII